jgi:formate dehydrogenase major subunit
MAKGDPMEAKALITMTIDGVQVKVEAGLTVLEAARQQGIHIPTLCHHADLSPWGGCRICVVEVDGAPKLAASCVTPVREGMKVITTNERILEARRTVLEFLFAERNHFCMFCGRSGDCELQALAYELQMDHLTVPSSYQSFPVDVTDDHIAIDHNRCILCGRCVRACREIAGGYVLNYQNRGPLTLIGKDLNALSEGSSCLSCGVCMQVCPTGAMLDRHRAHYAVKGKTKDWAAIDSVCTQCGLLCPISCIVKDDKVLKIEGRFNHDRPDRGQLCQRGRFDFMGSAEPRLLQPMVRGDGGWTAVIWDEALDLVANRLSSLGGGRGGDGVIALASGRRSNEELLLFREIMRQGWSAAQVGVLDGLQWTTASIWGRLTAVHPEPSWQRISEADFLLLVGARPQLSQPVIAALVRRAFFERRIELAVIADEDPFAPWTTHFIRTAAENRSAMVAGVGAAVEKAARANAAAVAAAQIGGFERERNPDPGTAAALVGVAERWVKAGNPMVIAGQGVWQDEAALRHLVELVGSKDRFADGSMRLLLLKPSGNSAGALRLGLYPPPNFAGVRRAGVILLDAPPESDAEVERLVEGLEFLAVLSPYFPATLAERAQVLLPIAHRLEGEGTYSAIDGNAWQSTNRVIQPPIGVRPGWEVLLDLARRSAFQPDCRTWEDLRRWADRQMQPFALQESPDVHFDLTEANP